MDLSPPQFAKLRQLASLARDLNVQQRARSDAYADCIVYQAQTADRLDVLEKEKLKRGKRLSQQAAERLDGEINFFRLMLDQAKDNAAELQASISNARDFLGPLNKQIDEVAKFVGVPRSELDMARGVGPMTPRGDILR